MIRLGLRLVFSGGREAAVRMALLLAAVGLGAGLLLTTVSGINAVNSQNGRYAWLATGAWVRDGGPARAGTQPLWWLLRADDFGGQTIGRVDVAGTGPRSPVPPGIGHLPGPGEYYVSPALAALMRGTPADRLADRYPGRRIGTIGDAALPSPSSLIIIIGHTAAQMARTPGAVRATLIGDVTPGSCGYQWCRISAGINPHGMDLVLSVAALALLFPVLIFIVTATRLSAARREQRFAAMRLAGATPRQVSLIAAVESTVAAAGGAAAGFGLFFLLRAPVAGIPFTGAPFFPRDLSLSLPDVLGVAVGVPAAAAVAARLALRRVHISPLGVSRRVTPKAPKAWRTLPLLAGLAELGFFAAHGRPPTVPGQIQAFLPGFALIMAGLVTAGPWLTMAGARIMALRTPSAGTLIAARRLADNPRAGFRAVSGLVLALFVTTVATALITTENAHRGGPIDGPAAGNVLEAFLYGQRSVSSPAPSAAELARLRSVGGVQGVVEVYADGAGGGRVLPTALVSCAQLASVPALGRCPAGAEVAQFPAFENTYPRPIAGITWPAAGVPASRLDGLPLYGIDVPTNGSAQAVERARTLLEASYPGWLRAPSTLGEDSAARQSVNNEYQQLADVVILTSLPIAGCTLAASVAAGLTDRKRPFSLLRLAGAPLRVLRRVVALESAVPLLAVAVVSVGLGLAASAMYSASEMRYPLAAPGAVYYLITAAGVAASLGIIAATFPLLRRITGPEVARNE